jgi:P63C domain
MSELTGKAKGGAARAEKLSPERRKEIASKAVSVRWEGARQLACLPQVLLKRDDIKIGEIKIPCAIVEGNNGEEPRRVLAEYGILNAILGEASGASKRKKKAMEMEGAHTPIFLAPGQLKPFINNNLNDKLLLARIEYVDGKKIAFGYDARILPIVCDIWLKAREAGALQQQQLDKAQKAEIVMRGLAHVGIIALVDEATGYQSVRAKDSLAKILEAFVAKELRPYVSKFPPEYYSQIFRLRGLAFPSGTVKRPSYFGHITNDVIYRRLAPFIWAELKEKAKKETAIKKPHLHRYLTHDVGDPRLQKVLDKVVTVMELSDSWQEFKAKLDRILPAYNDTMQLPFELSADTGQGF